MNEEGKKRYEETMHRYLTAQVSRSALIKAAALGTLAATGIPAIASANSPERQTYFEFPQSVDPASTLSGRYTPENIGDILNIAQTAEYFAVTFLTAALGNAAKIGLTANPLLLSIVQAILAAEITHVQLLTAVGATPLTTTFTVPDAKLISNFNSFWGAVETADTIFIGAYLAAIRTFAEQNQPMLAKTVAQIMGVEAEHRVLARGALALAGDATRVPPNNKAYETDLFVYVREAAGLLVALGFIGGSGTPAAFPGLDAATLATGPTFSKMIQKSPNNAKEGSTNTTNITGERA